jgi:hypothetical protein
MKERARIVSRCEARAESARIRSEIAQFFESYRYAFSRLDAEDVARHFCVTSTMSANDGDTVWTDASQVLNNMVALCDQSRAHGASEVHCELLDVIDQPPAHAFANVRWLIQREGGSQPRHFRTSYNLRLEAGQWRVLMCTAYEEQPPKATSRESRGV